MSIKRFLAKTTRDALHMVREALGPDGVILSNRAVDGGIEILALGSDDMTALVPTPVKDEAGAAARPHREEQGAQAGSQVPAINPPIEKNSPESEMGAGTNFKDLPRLKFPIFDGERGQLAKRRTTVDLAIESHQTKSLVVHKAAAAPDAAGRGKKRQPATNSRKTEHSIIKRIADQVANTLAESAKDSVTAESTSRGKKLRTKTSSRKTVNQIALKAGVPAHKRNSVSTARQVADEVAASVLREIKSM